IVIRGEAREARGARHVMLPKQVSQRRNVSGTLRRLAARVLGGSSTLAALVLAGLSTVVTAEDAQMSSATEKPLMVSFADLKWAELPERKGSQFALLTGDPTKGAYTAMRKAPAGTDNALHSHSSEIKNVIIRGTWYTGADAATAKDFGPGSVVVMPGGWMHVSGCRAGGGCVLSPEGVGYFHVDPAAQ